MGVIWDLEFRFDDEYIYVDLLTHFILAYNK